MFYSAFLPIIMSLFLQCLEKLGFLFLLALSWGEAFGSLLNPFPSLELCRVSEGNYEVTVFLFFS